jgi:hypothetical protein
MLPVSSPPPPRSAPEGVHENILANPNSLGPKSFRLVKFSD